MLESSMIDQVSVLFGLLKKMKIAVLLVHDLGVLVAGSEAAYSDRRCSGSKYI